MFRASLRALADVVLSNAMPFERPGAHQEESTGRSPCPYFVRRKSRSWASPDSDVIDHVIPLRFVGFHTRDVGAGERHTDLMGYQ